MPGERTHRQLMPQLPFPAPILRPPPGIRFLIFRWLLAESDEGGGNLPRLPDGRAVPFAARKSAARQTAIPRVEPEPPWAVFRPSEMRTDDALPT